MKTLLGITCALAALMAVFTSSAGAYQITQTAETIEQSFNGASYGGNFNQFDPSLGTLTGVSIQFNGEITYTATFENNGCTVNCFASFTFSTGYSFNAPGFPITSFSNGASFYATANYQGATTYPNLDMQSQSRVITSPIFEVPPSIFSSYEGSGIVSIIGGVSEDSDFCFGSLRCRLSNLLDLKTVLIYDVTPVPEPATWLVFLVGLIGLGAFFRVKTRALL